MRKDSASSIKTENGLRLIEMVNDCAEIVPGKSAAGFDLGASINEVKSSICSLSEWQTSSGIPLYEAIRSESGWLAYVRENGEEVLYFGNGMIELNFSAEGVLFNIFISNEYAGALWGDVKVGSPLSMAQQHYPLEYDEGDEMHYPTEESAVIGVAFYAEELPLEEAPDQLISGISVHNWSMSR
ncbi:hypothetical protein [Chitinivorax sp. B]|uniref:hypothetical protein n=1 Tax=Chitinivorax sp. B TaxID=2502235 RepID=UPI001484D549|nr:hypothetical protein [Chitinivorax sp. B]